MSTEGNSASPYRDERTRIGALLALAGIAVIAAPFLLLFWVYAANISFWFETAPADKSLASIMVQKFHVFFGLPAAAVFSLLLVSVLRQTAGPIEFKGLGFEFKGSSGQIVLWLVCFLGIAAAIKMLW
jgi:hypothetical protein